MNTRIVMIAVDDLFQHFLFIDLLQQTARLTSFYKMKPTNPISMNCE